MRGCRARRLIRALLAFAVQLLVAAHLLGQPTSTRALRVHGTSERCLEERAIAARIAHYMEGAEWPEGVLIDLEFRGRSAEFTVFRDGAAVSRRQFERLPQACADRRDIVALTIAVAVVHVVEPDPANDIEALPGAESELAALDGTRSSEPPEELGRDSAAGSSGATKNVVDPSMVNEKRSTVTSSSTRSPQQDVRTDETSGDTDGTDNRLLRVYLYSGGRVVSEVLPAPGVLFGAGGGLLLSENLALELAGLGSLAQRSPLAGGNVRTQFIGGEALTCGRMPLEFLTVLGCVGVGAGRVEAQGEGYNEDLQTDRLWLAALLRGAVRLDVAGPVSMQIAAGGHGNLTRPRFDVVGSPALPQVTKIVGGSVGLDLVFRMW